MKAPANMSISDCFTARDRGKSSSGRRCHAGVAPLWETTMSREPFVTTEEMHQKARMLAGIGVPQEAIAKHIGCSPKTLRLHFREDLDRGVADANTMVAGWLFNAAKNGNVTAAIFWLKTRARWREWTAKDDFQTRSLAEQVFGGEELEL
jgi:hypothetical protein